MKLINFVKFPCILVAYFVSMVISCYQYQSCLTPRNRFGRYVTTIAYLNMTEDLQKICSGVCKYNKTTEYICCAHWDKPSEKRISQLQCEADHSRYGVIIHGTEAKRNEFPFMAAIGWRALFGTNKISYKCGGALISRKYVLTAAHCLYHSDEPPIVVRPGGFDLNDTEAEDIEIDQIYEHPGYKYSSVYDDSDFTVER